MWDEQKQPKNKMEDVTDQEAKMYIPMPLACPKASDVF